MDKSLDSLVNLIEEKSKTDPELRRLWATATITFKFAELISALRNEKGWSEEELATNSGCSTEVVLDMESPNPEAIPTLEDMVRVSECLGYEINLNLSPLGPDVSIDRVEASVYGTVFEDIRVIGEHWLTEPDVNESIAVVAVDSGGRVRLPKGIGIEKDNEAMFHSIPLQVKKDEC